VNGLFSLRAVQVVGDLDDGPAGHWTAFLLDSNLRQQHSAVVSFRKRFQ
jgi:hypothetical protein